jgi:hypothetical protein
MMHGQTQIKFKCSKMSGFLIPAMTAVNILHTISLFLGALAKLRKATKSFVGLPVLLPVHPSGHPQGTTWFPLDGFS